jgi:aldehyde dehydrogenase (NAD+)
LKRQISEVDRGYAVRGRQSGFRKGGKTVQEILKSLGIEGRNPGGFAGVWTGSGEVHKAVSPIQGNELAKVVCVTEGECGKIISAAAEAFLFWRTLPAPKRGEVVRALGEELRKQKELLGLLITLEMGKPLQEGLGEVQEMIDICDYAVGLSRQLYGLTMQSERRKHRMFEQWHPLGAIGVITAFNFPVAVWSWNATLALVCGDTVIWKPSSKTPLSAIATTRIAERVLNRFGYPTEICSLLIGKGGQVGDLLTRDRRVSLISYTGSVEGGKRVGKRVHERFGKLILELGGNNAVVVSEKGSLDVALKNVYFGAIGTAGQRCTTTRRVIIHETVYDTFVNELTRMYEHTPVGDPRDVKNVMGPLVDTKAVDLMLKAIERIRQEGGRIIYGGGPLTLQGGCYVVPCLVEAPAELRILQRETFAPILYLIKYRDLEEAIRIHNDVPQGLSSAIITDNLTESETFLSGAGSDCGIANVNLGTTGAEIGGAFGGEKETGGGRESGSDAWKAYMRRQTCTVNFSGAVELAQGIQFFRS